MSDVYFIATGNPPRASIKIGHASDVGKRLVMLQVGNHRRLHLLGTVPGDRRLEREIHLRFSHLRFRGEWFRWDTELASFIEYVTSEWFTMNGPRFFERRNYVEDVFLHFDAELLARRHVEMDPDDWLEQSIREDEQRILPGLTADSQFVGLTGQGFPHSFWRAYVRDRAGQWWGFHGYVWSVDYDPSVILDIGECRSSGGVVCGKLSDAAKYDGKPGNTSLQKLLARARELAA